ncbi:hypothetical protein [Flammeovirga sp. EKP202]|uniref:hypothetical protein n=1 Tax=Flammeovirga sp. EKP202 TaxID=2770592 RepID=UPI00165ED0CF|nr:hypothetical protein [Flammeovirga sp. EKP202]MBD0405219.1 hypothetical protein [Flammeovirga sp. EKP202]
MKKYIFLFMLTFCSTISQIFCQKVYFTSQEKEYDKKTDTYLLKGNVETTVDYYLFSNDCTLVNELEGLYTFYGSKDKPILITDLSDSLEEYKIDSTYVLDIYENEDILPYHLQDRPCGDSFIYNPAPHYESDSTTFNMRTQILKLYHNAFIKFDNISFKGEEIEMNFITKTLTLKGSNTFPIQSTIILSDSIPHSSNDKLQKLLNTKKTFYIKDNCKFDTEENRLEYQTN